MHPTDTWLTRAFEASYKESSAKSYVARMRMVVNKTQSDFFDVMTRPDHYWPAIRDTYYADSIGTRRAIATLVLAAFKLVPDDTLQHYAKQHARWRSLLKTTSTLDDAERARHAMTPSEQKAWVPLNEIREKVVTLAKERPHATKKRSLQFLLLSIYATLPPKRSDLGNVRIVHGRDPGRSDANYFVLDPPRGQLSYLVLHVYKTAAKHGRLVTEFPRKLTAVLKESIRLYPRDFLFVDSRDDPYVHNASYGAFVRNTFRAMFGKAAGTSLLRHIYITDSKLFDSSTPDDVRESIHHQMGHSEMTALSYRKQTNVPSARSCSCICENISS